MDGPRAVSKAGAPPAQARLFAYRASGDSMSPQKKKRSEQDGKKLAPQFTGAVALNIRLAFDTRAWPCHGGTNVAGRRRHQSAPFAASSARRAASFTGRTLGSSIAPSLLNVSPRRRIWPSI